jgi:hypothetical protein
MKKEIVDFANATPAQAKHLIRCGFEFEYHAHNGSDNNDSDEIDHERLSEDSSEAVSNADLDDIVSDNDKSGQLILALAKFGIYYGEYSSIFTGTNKQIGFDLERYYEQCETNWRDNWEESALSNNDYNLASEAQIDNLPSYVSIGDDPSVRGGEIRTNGPRTVKEFLAAAEILANEDFEVDQGCSFHIHLSLPGVEHSYGKHFQADMYAYILSQWNRLPEGVKERLTHVKGGLKWAKFNLSNENKYVAIFKHSLNTWEFRLFGNITQYDEMKVCLELAIEAMQHAYQVKLGMVSSLNRKANLEVLGQTFNMAYTLKRFDLYFILLAKNSVLPSFTTVLVSDAQRQILANSLAAEQAELATMQIGA